MASPKKPTSAVSRSFQSLDSRWESVLIDWGTKRRDDLHGTTPFPFVEPKGDRRLNQVTFFDKNPLRETAQGYNYTPVCDLLKNRPPAFTEQIVVPIKSQDAQADNTGVAESGRQRQIRQGIRQLKSPTRGLVCTSVAQWIRVEVKTKTPVPEIPPLRLWAFLQPAHIGGTQGAIAQDDKDCRDDFPRSGWAEYHVLPGASSCMRKDWDEGKSVEHELSGSQWTSKQMDSTTFVYKIRVEIKNQRTAADLARWKNRKDKTRPEMDCEAGCWLKVWVRDEAVDWGVNPSDDETNTLPDRMDAMDPISPEIDFVDLRRIKAAHGFLRERIFSGPENPEEFGKASPVYAVLFNEHAMEHLVELHKLLKPDPSGTNRQVVSQVVFSAAALLSAAGLRLGLDVWKSQTPASRPPDVANDVVWPDAMDKLKSETMIQLIESLELSANLAVLASDGFAHDSLIESRKAASPALVSFWSKIYGTIFDFAFADGPAHYREFCLNRLAKRAELLKERIQYTQHEQAEQKVAAGKKEDDARKKQAAWDAHTRKSKGLGLLRGTSGVMGKAKTEATSFAIEVPGKSWKTSHSLPAPAGAPLPIPFVPLVWGLKYGASAEFKLTFKLEVDEKTAEWIFSARFSGIGKAELSFGLHALWSSLVEADSAGGVDDFQQNKKKSNDANPREDLAAVKAEIENQRKKALENPCPECFTIFQLLKKLNEYVAFDLEVGASIDLSSSVGFSFHWNPDTGDHSLRFLAGEGGGKGKTVDRKDFRLNLGLKAKARACVSVIKVDYPLATFPGIANVDALGASFSLDGQILGQPLPDREEIKFRWGKGRLADKICPCGTGEPLVWGKTAKFRLDYFDLPKPEVAFCLRQTASDAEVDFASLPEGSVSCRQSGSNGTLDVALTLTSRKTPRDDTQIAAGSWGFSEAVVKSEVERVQKGIGALKGLVNSALGMDEGDNALVGGTTPSAKWIEQLVKNPSGGSFFLHASYLSTEKSKSDPLQILRPHLAKCQPIAKPGLVQIAVQLENFLDNVLWVQLRKRSPGSSTRIFTQDGQAWKILLIEQITTYGLNGRAGVLQIPLKFPANTEEVGEVYPWISLVPHPSGVLNADFAPRHEHDSERWIGVERSR